VSLFVLHPEASGDLDEIREFIAQDNLKAADRVIGGLHEAIRGLVLVPHQGHRPAHLTSRPVRFMTVGNHVIAYAPDEKPLAVIAVLHRSRSPRVMAATLRGREQV
jgi:plasmid stabilization system protein ParE